MNLKELRGCDGCSELLYKLNNLFKDKWNSICVGVTPYSELCSRAEYFERLGCEVVFGPIEFRGSEDFVPVSFDLKKYKESSWRVHINVPIGLAEKVLVLGLP